MCCARCPRSGITVLLVDHDMSVVLGVCDTVHVLDFGGLIASGTPGRDPQRPDGHLGLPRHPGPGMSAERLLDVRGLVAGYDGIAVVHGVDLHVDAGEVVALLGANGAGKTTTLLTVSGVLPVIDGGVTVLGEDQPVRRRARHRRGRAHGPAAASPTCPRTAACSST